MTATKTSTAVPPSVAPAQQCYSQGPGVRDPWCLTDAQIMLAILASTLLLVILIYALLRSLISRYLRDSQRISAAERDSSEDVFSQPRHRQQRSAVQLPQRAFNDPAASETTISRASTAVTQLQGSTETQCRPLPVTVAMPDDSNAYNSRPATPPDESYQENVHDRHYQQQHPPATSTLLFRDGTGNASSQSHGHTDGGVAAQQHNQHRPRRIDVEQLEQMWRHHLAVLQDCDTPPPTYEEFMATVQNKAPILASRPTTHPTTDPIAEVVLDTALEHRGRGQNTQTADRDERFNRHINASDTEHANPPAGSSARESSQTPTTHTIGFPSIVLHDLDCLHTNAAATSIPPPNQTTLTPVGECAPLSGSAQSFSGHQRLSIPNATWGGSSTLSSSRSTGVDQENRQDTGSSILESGSSTEYMTASSG